MNRYCIRQLIVVTLCLYLAMPAAAWVRPQQAPAPSPKEEFVFTKVDLDLLEEVNLLDRKLEREGLVYADDATNTYLQRIGQTLLPRGLHLENVVWKFRAVRDPTPNAFALPNGSIYITTGLFALMDNESQVASVIAHEMTHVLRRHTYLQNRSNRKKFLAMNIMAAVGAYAPGGVVGAVINVVTAVAPFIVMATMFGYSRDLEREADLKGIDMMIAAEYPPEEMVKTMKVLKLDIEGEEIRYFYNDHPALQERINYLSSYLGARADTVTPQMELHREKTAYFAQAEGIMRHDIRLAMNAARFRSALYLAQRLVEFGPNSSENVFLLAEAYRNLGPRSPQLSERELTNSAKKDAAKKRAKQTPEEEARDLLATPEGRQYWQTHQQKAEELYLRAGNLENPFPAIPRGLGMLYEQLGRPDEAVTQYEKYLQLAPAAMDRERIQRRIEGLRRPRT